MDRIPAAVAGNLTRDPELRQTEDRRSALLRVAVTPRHYNPQMVERVDQETAFVSAWVNGQQAQHVAEALRKGDRVVIVGRWTTRKLDGGDVHLEISVDEIGSSLRFRI